MKTLQRPRVDDASCASPLEWSRGGTRRPTRVGASARAFWSRARVSDVGVVVARASSRGAVDRGRDRGVGALAGAQAFALHALYEALPDATGPTEGIAAPNTIFPTVAERPASPILAKAGREARELFDRSVRPKLEGVGDAGPKHRRSSDATSTRTSRARAPPGSIATARPDPSSIDPDDVTHPVPARVVVVLGDSLVTGVGASDAAAGYGPVLPRRVGERLAERTGERVAWIAVGKRAADAATIRRDVVPALRRRLHTPRDRPSVGFVGDGFRTDDDEDDDGDGTRRDVRDGVRTDDARVDVDAVVLMCGVNDFKRAPWGRTPEAFRRELDALVDEVRDVVGERVSRRAPGRAHGVRDDISPAVIVPRRRRERRVGRSKTTRRRDGEGRAERRRIGPNRGSDRIAGARLATTVLLDTVSRARDVRGETDGGPDGSFRAGRDGEGWNTPERVGLRGVGALHRGRGARGDDEGG